MIMMKHKLSFISALLLLASYCQAQKLFLINCDTSILFEKTNPFRIDKLQLNVEHVSGILQGRIMIQTKTVLFIKGKYVTVYDTIREMQLIDGPRQQAFLIDLFFDRIVIITKGVCSAKIHWFIKFRS